jgi:hypothetical protein
MKGALRTKLWLALVLLLAWMPAQPAAASEYRFAGVERVVAFGDVHGAYEGLVQLLRGTGIIDAELNWSGGETHLVSLGDLLDRGDYGRQVMDLLMRLQEEAAEAGGAVHVVYGNHEVMVLVGDLRYVSDGDYAQFGSERVGDFPPGFFERRAALAPDGEYGRWLLDFPVMVVVNDSLFVHGGISSRLEGMSLGQINEAAMRDIRRFAEGWHVLLEAGRVADKDGLRRIIRAAAGVDRGADAQVREAASDITEAADGLPFVPDGPLWYRGNARCHPYVETEPTARLLEQFGASRVVIGHTPTYNRRINSRLDGRVIAADVGMLTEYYGGKPAAVEIQGDELRAWYVGEGWAEVAPEPNRTWDRPGDLSDAEIEEFLRSAEVKKMERARRGSPRRVVLERDGLEIEAVFNTRDSVPGLEHGRWRRAAERADRYRHEIAAYRLDRMLDLQMVPVTVERSIGEETGSLRLWIPESFSEEQRRNDQIPFRGSCDLAPMYDLMSIFDLLIFNADHDLATLRYDRHWQLWLTDHSRAFGLATDVESTLRRAELRPTPQMREALGRLDSKSLAELAPYLHPRQVDALLNRARQLQQAR